MCVCVYRPSEEKGPVDEISCDVGAQGTDPLGNENDGTVVKPKTCISNSVRRLKKKGTISGMTMIAQVYCKITKITKCESGDALFS